MLFLADVKVELEKQRGRLGQQALEGVDELIARAPDLPRDEFMHSHDEHILIMRAVTAFDVACKGRLGVYALQEIVGELFFHRRYGAPRMISTPRPERLLPTYQLHTAVAALHPYSCQDAPGSQNDREAEKSSQLIRQSVGTTPPC